MVRQLYTRDTRRQFCRDDHWINDRITLPLDRPHDITFRRSRLRQYRPFQGLRVFTREELGELCNDIIRYIMCPVLASRSWTV